MRLPYCLISDFALVYLAAIADITFSAHVPRDYSWSYGQFHSPDVPLRDIDTHLAPAVIATSDFLRRGYQACR